MLEKCPRKVSRKSGNLIPKILEMPGRKSNGTEIPGKEFPQISIYLTRVVLFSGKCRKILFHSTLEISEIQTGVLG